MNHQHIKQFCEKQWDDSITNELIEYIKIPCKSPMFDSNWEANGYIQQAVDQFTRWAEQHAAKDMQLEVVRLPGRTPLIYIDVPGQGDETVLLYGHMDKQPEMVGWESELGPWKPVLRDDKLYGRGGADDGYALFASLTAILALQEQNIPHSRCVIIIEACEESGSYDLPFYIDQLHERIGSPSLIVCLDSGAGNYEQMWSTTSLRGVMIADLKVQVLTEGVHSGAASGAVPDSFRILRQLLSRIEDETTGEITLAECHVDIPAQRIQQAEVAANILDESIYRSFPFAEDTILPNRATPVDNLLYRTWYPTLTVTGMDGVPPLENAGNVLRPETTARLSFRLPPTCDPETAASALRKVLETNPPQNAKVTFTNLGGEAGWNAPTLADWLAEAANQASQHYFGKDTAYIGEGGSIPFMGMLGEKFPQAQFLITGVLGPNSNAHGPNEFLHIPMAKKLTCCVADVLSAHYQEFSS